MLTLLSCLPLAAFAVLPADSMAAEDVYVRAADAILHDSASALFLRRDGRTHDPLTVCLAESLYTLDRFPFDAYPGDSAVSVYKADMLRPVRSFPTAWPARLRCAGPPDGMLFIARREGSSIIAELFVFDPRHRSYEAYCIASDSMKFLLHVTRGNRVAIAGRVRLLR